MNRPRVSTNLAISADGKISSVSRRPSGWTSLADHERLIELRREADALLVGRGTWENDRMTMVVPERYQQPLRCIVSRSGGLDPAHPIFRKPGGPIHLLITGDQLPDALPDVIVYRSSLADYLELLVTHYGVRAIHCEGGGQLVRELAALDAIDEFHLTLAGHTIFSGADAPTATGASAGYLPASLEFELTTFEPLPASGECFLSYRRKRA